MDSVGLEEAPLLSRADSIKQALFRSYWPAFFLSWQLFWAPVMEPCWWALDFPFIGRCMRQQLVRFEPTML